MRESNLQISFAELEFQRMGVRPDPILEQISAWLDAHPELTDAVRPLLIEGLKNPRTGRRGLTAEQTLRSVILMRIKNWDYRELAERICDGVTLRRFTHFHDGPVPRHTAFHRAHRCLTPDVMEKINDLAVVAAVDDQLEDGKKLRCDTMVVETNIHWPTDATLLWDVVRVAVRTIKQLRQLVPHRIPKFPDRYRAARRTMQKLQRMTAAQRETQQTPAYRKLLGLTAEVLGHCGRAIEATAPTASHADNPDGPEVLRQRLIHYRELGERVVDQTRRRVLEGKQLAASEKVYSIFEPHTDLIKRGKTNKPIEFGHKVFLAESANGLITQYRVLDGNPTDDTHVEGSLDRHEAKFGGPPELFANDRGFYSSANLAVCEKHGVGLACIPQRGGQKTPERAKQENNAAFKAGQRFRAGIEGTISVLMRGRGMRRCNFRGKERFAVLIGAAVLTNNLMRIANLLIAAKKKRPAPSGKRRNAA